MVPRKGQGHSKGKQRKWPVVVLSFSEEEESVADQQAILEQLAALEQAQGISPGGPSS